jgi:hypothetical protein
VSDRKPVVGIVVPDPKAEGVPLEPRGFLNVARVGRILSGRPRRSSDLLDLLAQVLDAGSGAIADELEYADKALLNRCLRAVGRPERE